MPNRRFFRTFLLFTFFIISTRSCPTKIQSACDCANDQEGIVLQCVGQNIHDLVRLLLTNQAQLGLVRQLTIQNSPVVNLTSRFFDGLYIKKLAIQNCDIQHVDSHAFDGLANTLQDLNLAHNKIKEMPSDALVRLSSLLTINLSNNSIGDLKAEHALPSLQKLFEVNLGNNEISDVHKSFFDNVKNNIQSVNLGHNELKAVPASALRGFRQLVALHLHSNKIQTLDSLSFMNLPVVSLLNLANNQIRSISRQAFINVPKLRYFYLTDNAIEDVLPSQFASFEQLEMLDMTNNRISNLDAKSFSNLPQLKQLYLGNNRIAHIQPEAFTNSSINVLILESNQLEEVNEQMIRGLPQLQQISLKENKIKTVSQNAFYDTPSLVMIDLSHNQIFDLAPSTFVTLQNILLLDLSYNKILRVPYSAFGRRVVTVLLQENPLVCSERIHMLQQGVGVLIPTQEDVVCGPQRSINNTISQQQKSETISTKSATNETVSTTNPLQTHQNPILHNEDNIREAFRQAEFEQQQFEKQSGLVTPINHNDEPRLNPTVPPIPGISTEQDRSEEIPSRPNGRTSTIGSELPIHRLNIGNNIQRLSTTQRSEQMDKTKELQSTRQPTTPTKSDDLATNGTRFVSDLETTTVDIANIPGRLYPLPVPFLTGPQNIHQAISLGSQTLPPSIVIANRGEVDTNKIHSSEQPTITTSSKGTDKPVAIEEKRRNEIFDIDELNRRIEHTSHDSAASTNHAAVDTAVIQGDRNLPTLMMIICLSTVAVVLVAVFVGMCFVYRRRGGMPFAGSSNSSVTTRSNTYYGTSSNIVQHPTTSTHQFLTQNQFNASQLSTLQRARNNSNTYATPTAADDVYTWLYAPGPYSAYPNK
ncbi:hypothetical protein M3Y96_00899500 [Aphelenchoides besseyi]|nr:hypothetical protein M3Y96_00899500 [Aphelenchoides besseyi]